MAENMGGKNPAAVELGRRGGLSRSVAQQQARSANIVKARAARGPGKMGGWPKGKLRGPRKPKVEEPGNG